MKIYIASSWRNQHGVQMLTQVLRNAGHTVISWIENSNKEMVRAGIIDFDFEEWVATEDSNQSFEFDTNGATTCDVFIYYAPAGKDACAELGAAWASGILIIGLYAKGEDLGLMRKMVSQWFTTVDELIEYISRPCTYVQPRPKTMLLYNT